MALDARPEHEGRLVIGRCPTAGVVALFALDAALGGQCVVHEPHGAKAAGCGKRMALCRTCGARSRLLDVDNMPGPYPRPDLCAFLMLHDLFPGARDMICSASHDEIWLDVDCDELAKVATDDFIRDLVRCGVRYDGSLCMFV